MEIKSILIKDTTREERIRIVQEGLSQCGGACDFCNGCDNLGGGSVDTFYEPYINGEKELPQGSSLTLFQQLLKCLPGNAERLFRVVFGADGCIVLQRCKTAEIG